MPSKQRLSRSVRLTALVGTNMVATRSGLLRAEVRPAALTAAFMVLN